MGCTGFKNVIHKFYALHTPLKPRIFVKFSSKNKQALPINIVIIRRHFELGMKVQRSYS